MKKQTIADAKAGDTVYVSSKAIVVPDGLIRQAKKGKEGTKERDQWDSLKVSLAKHSLENGVANYLPIFIRIGKENEKVLVRGMEVTVTNQPILIDGMQRVTAANEINAEKGLTLKAEVVSEERAEEIQISSGLHRVAFKPAEIGAKIRAEIEKNPSITIDDILKKYSISSKQQLERYVKLTALSQDLQEAVNNKEISIANGVRLHRLLQKVCRSKEEEAQAIEAAKTLTQEEFEAFEQKLQRKHDLENMDMDKIMEREYKHKPAFSMQRLNLLKEQLRRERENMEMDNIQPDEFFRGKEYVVQYLFNSLPEDIQEAKQKFELKKQQELLSLKKKKQD